MLTEGDDVVAESSEGMPVKAWGELFLDGSGVDRESRTKIEGEVVRESFGLDSIDIHVDGTLFHNVDRA
jgi:uncharacterized protein YgfB (UPF0149 family)